MGWVNKDSCIILFNKLKVLPLISKYTLSQLIFVVNSRDKLLINSEINNMNTRQNSNLHLHSANFDIYQNGLHYSGM
jgi:hypothetical protein